MEGLYGDGGNLYEYLGSSPWGRGDTLGLSWDPFDMVDDYLAASTGARTAFLSQVGQGAKAVAVAAATLASYLPVPVVSQLGDLALYALGEQSGRMTAVSIAMGIVPGGKLVDALGGFLSRVGRSASDVAGHYARHGRITFGRLRLGLTDDAVELAKRKPPSLCSCFAAGTVVWTAMGPLPIDQVRSGDEVLTVNEITETVELQSVLMVIVTPRTAPLQLAVSWGLAQSETFSTTDEHLFRRADGSWARADELAPGDRIETVLGIAAIHSLRFETRRSTVYDLWVEDNHNYLVGFSGALVHNCIPIGTPAPFRDIDKAAQAARKNGLDVQAHHLIERRHFRNGPLVGNPNDFPGVVLTRPEHQRVTNLLRHRLAYTGAPHGFSEIYNAHRIVYVDELGRPDWWAIIEPYLRQLEP